MYAKYLPQDSIDVKSGKDFSSAPRDIWLPDNVGVGGISASALSAPLDRRLGIIACESLAEWVRSARGTGGGGDAARFPYFELLAHYQAVGRAAASSSLVRALDRLIAPGPGEPAPALPFRLRTWIESATDQLNGDYHTYAGIPLQEDFLNEASSGTCEATTDALTMALLLDLLRIEGEALGLAPTLGQRKRFRAVYHAVRRAGELAPSALPHVPGLAVALDLIDADTAGPEAPERAAEITASAAGLPDADRLAGLTMLPMTPLHDEQMFLRSIQLFECLYLWATWQLEAVTSALTDASAERAIALLDGMATRFDAALAFYRILATMPSATFAIIRAQTDGRSALQSRTYRRVEALSARRPADEDSWGRDAPALTLEEAFLGTRRRSRAGAEGVAAAMRRVDDRWRGMKRAHWGITVKTIGDSTGTGGTSGASYLYETSRMPLFPALASPSDKGSPRR